MKQKYVLMKNAKKKELVIQEFAELDKEILSLLCEETYAGDAIQTAIKEGFEELVDVLRTPNMYPIGQHAERIAESVTNLYKARGNQTAELLFDDLDLIAAQREKELAQLEEMEAESEDIDELLTDDVDQDLKGDLAIDKIKSALKVVDEPPADTEDEG